MEHTALYRTIWRWHFYAGLLVIPLVLVLSLTGAALSVQTADRPLGGT